MTGQYLLKSVESQIDDILNKKFGTTNVKYHIYTDTDSLAFNLSAPIKKYAVPAEQQIKMMEKISNEILTTEVNKLCQSSCDVMNSYTNKISFKSEAAASAAIWCGKKKYVMRVHSSEGVTYAQPKFKVKGLELVRSSTPGWVRERLKNALFVIFDGNEQTTQKYIQDAHDEFVRLSVEQIAFPRSANNLSEYSDKATIYRKGTGTGTPIQVRGALLYNHYIKQFGVDDKYQAIGEGEKIKFVYLRTPNKLKENVIAFPVDGVLPPEFGVHDKVDVEMQFEKTFLSAMEIILKAISWKAVQTSSLDEFF